MKSRLVALSRIVAVNTAVSFEILIFMMLFSAPNAETVNPMTMTKNERIVFFIGHPQHGHLFCASLGQEFRQQLVDAIGLPAADLGFDDRNKCLHLS